MLNKIEHNIERCATGRNSDISPRLDPTDDQSDDRINEELTQQIK